MPVIEGQMLSARRRFCETSAELWRMKISHWTKIEFIKMINLKNVKNYQRCVASKKDGREADVRDRNSWNFHQISSLSPNCFHDNVCLSRRRISECSYSASSSSTQQIQHSSHRQTEVSTLFTWRPPVFSRMMKKFRTNVSIDVIKMCWVSIIQPKRNVMPSWSGERNWETTNLTKKLEK